MDFFAWELNNANAGVPRMIANYAQVTEVRSEWTADFGARASTIPTTGVSERQGWRACWADMPAWWTAWRGMRTRGPLNGVVSGGGGGTCFCQFCQAKGRERGISGRSAPRREYRQMGQLFHATGRDGAAGGWLLHFILEAVAEVSRDFELGVAVDGQLSVGIQASCRTG